MIHVRRLFEHPADVHDVLGHAAFLDRARAEREVHRETGSRLALAAYLVARLVDRVLARPDLASADALRWQLQSTRTYLVDLPRDLPESAHLAGVVEAAEVAATGRPAMLRMSLTAYAYFLEQEGRLEEALDMLALQARTFGDTMPEADFIGTALFAGRLQRLLARWDAARAAYGHAAEVAADVGDRVSMLLGRLGQANVLRGQGNLPQARAEVEAVIAAARDAGDVDVQARAFADLGAVYDRMGDPEHALGALYQTFRLTQDPHQRMRTLGDIGIILADLGALEVARTAFQLVIESRSGVLVRLNARLELMALEARCGDQMSFERHRQSLRAEEAAMTPSMAIDYRAKVGAGLARFGRERQARGLLTEALRMAEECQLNQWYFKVEQQLRDLSVPAARPAQPAGSVVTPAVAEIASGLREYAASAS